MEIESKTFHTTEPDTHSIINFPKGLPGFENHTEFRLFEIEGSKIVFSLQSVSDENTAFSVAHPSHFNINYSLMLTDEEDQLLDFDSLDDLLILLILHKDDNAEQNQPTIKGSIKSPLLINTKKRVGLQKTLETIEQSITLTEKNNEIEVSEA